MSKNDINDTDEPFELDRIQLPKTDSDVGGAVEAIHTASIVSANHPEKGSKAETRKKSRRKTIFVIIMAISITVLGTISYFLWEPEEVIRPSQHEENTYQMIGPIITNVDPKRRIKISLNIRYSTEIEQASVLKLRIKNDILTFLTSPETKKKLAESNSADQKHYLERTITNLVRSDYIDDVIFTQIEVY